MVIDSKNYLIDNGIECPVIIPVSAQAASIFKKALNGEALTRSEYRSFLGCYELYMPKDYNMKSYAVTEELPNQFEEIKVRGETYRAADIVRAIENTGIRLLEENIQKAQILSGGKLVNSVRIK